MSTKYLGRVIGQGLIEWEKVAKHKPLLLCGARQVGKSSIVRELGKLFDSYLGINFKAKGSESAKAVFERSSGPRQKCNESRLYTIDLLSRERHCCFWMKFNSVFRPFLHCVSFMKTIPNNILLPQVHCLNLHWTNCPLFG